MEVKPLTPDQIKPEPVFHPTMIQVVNELLQKHFDGKQAVIQQKDIISRFVKLESKYKPDRVLKEKLLDFENVYRNAGWKVAHDKPGYNENPYEPTFTFTRKLP